MLELILAAVVASVMLVVLVSMLVTALEFPYDTDRAAESSTLAARRFYQQAYVEQSMQSAHSGSQIDEYVDTAWDHVGVSSIPAELEDFVRSHGLAHARVLDVGAGTGFFQDLVDGYTAIDLSWKAHRFFHKPFVTGSATSLPFGGATFDALWSIWMLEHVANPERALEEMRRVIKPGGCLFLRPAWDCDPWAADGYEVRPYGELSLKGKLIKASIPLRVSRWYALFHVRQVRLIRALVTVLSRQPARLHFRRLRPNYERFWVTDSDAAVALDFYETALWFRSRGDECVNCPSVSAQLFGLPHRRPKTLIVRINKPQRQPHHHEKRHDVGTDLTPPVEV